MKQLFFNILFFVWANGIAHGQGTFQVVVPSGLATVEGNASSGDLFRTASSQFQQVYAASEFPTAAGYTSRIDGVSFRLDGNTGQSFVGIWRGVSVILATTTQQPDSLSPVYADNADPNATEVFAGSLSIVANSTPGLREFQVHIRFDIPFYYNPMIGNLSMLLGTTSGSTAILLDAQNVAGDSVGRVFGANTPVGVPDTTGLVTLFDITTVPEPSVKQFIFAVLLALSFARFSVFQHQKRDR